MHEQLKSNKFGQLVDLYYEGRSLSEAESSALEKQVKETPNNPEIRAKLLGGYLLPTEVRRGVDPTLRYRAHLLWIVEHYPNDAIGPECTHALLPEEDPELFEELSLLWKRKMEEYPKDFDIAFNASIFFESAGLMKTSLEVVQSAKKLIGKDHIIDARIRFLKRLIQQNPREETWKKLVKDAEDFERKGD